MTTANLQETMNEAGELSRKYPEKTATVYETRRLGTRRVISYTIRFESPKYFVDHGAGKGYAFSPVVCFVDGRQLNPLACKA